MTERQHGNPPVPRHSLLWFRTCPIVVSGDSEQCSSVAAWWRQGQPFAAAREPARDGVGPTDWVVRFSAPRSSHSRRPARVSCLAPREHLIRVAPPPRLEAVCPTLIGKRQTDAEAVLDVARQCALSPRVYGPSMWQYLSGKRYVTEKTRLHVLWDVSGHEQARQLSDRLSALEPRLTLRLSGEFRFGDRGDVAWKEWSKKPWLTYPRMVVRRADSVELVDRSSFSAFALTPNVNPPGEDPGPRV